MADPTGLTHLGARDYDPTTGRFISIDPIFDRANPQSWNGYAYGNNAPTTSSDPTGTIEKTPTDGLGDCDAECQKKRQQQYDKCGIHGEKCKDGKPKLKLPSKMAPPPPPPWEKYIPYVNQVSQRLGLDPALILSTFIVEGGLCFNEDFLCGPAQWVQVNAPNPLLWLGSSLPFLFHRYVNEQRPNGASIGYANFKKATFEEVKAGHPELNGAEWTDLTGGNAELSIDLLAYHMSDLKNQLEKIPLAQRTNTYDKRQLIQLGFNASAGDMIAIAKGSGVEPNTLANLRQYDLAYGVAQAAIERSR